METCFETSTDFLFHSFDGFGYVTIKRFSHRHNRNRFVMFEYLGTDLIISHVKLVFPFVSFSYPKII